MRFVSNVWIRLFLGLNAATLATVGWTTVQGLVTSKAAISQRAKGLEIVAKHHKAETCWINKSEEPFKLGDRIETAGTEEGKLPTGCIIAPKTQQVLQVAYLDGELKVIQIYSRRELKNQLSKKETN